MSDPQALHFLWTQILKEFLIDKAYDTAKENSYAVLVVGDRSV